MSVPERKAVISKFKLCFNCLNYGHQVSSCNYPGCPRCGKNYNSKIDIDDPVIISESMDSADEDSSSNVKNAVLHAANSTKHTSATMATVMLATAMIDVHASNGQLQRCRAVLDSGSQLNFITHSCAQRLQLTKTNISLTMSGVGTMSSSTVRLMSCAISSRCQTHKFKISLLSALIGNIRVP